MRSCLFTLLKVLGIGLLLVVGLIVYLGTRTTTLSKSDLEWMPYEGWETLVFESNDGKTDTLFLMRKDKGNSSRGEYGMNKAYESVRVNYLTRNYWDVGDTAGYGWKGYDWKSIWLSAHNPAQLTVYFSGRDANYYGKSWHDLDSLNKVKPTKLSTAYDDYNDVYIFEASEEDEAEYGDRTNYVTKLYWSKKEGLVRYDKKNNVHYELQKKYINKDPRFADY